MMEGHLTQTAFEGLLPKATGGDARVLLVVMPWAPPQFPALGPTLLRSILIRDGIQCDILYANAVFSKFIDNDPIVERQLMRLPLSEIAFTPFYFGTSLDEAARLLWGYIAPYAADPSLYPIRRFEAVVQKAGECLDFLANTISWDAYDIVGFSVMMQQTVPSLALAKRIKRQNSRIKIVFGGPNASAPMGSEMLRAFPEIDYVVEGEADAVITPLAQGIRTQSKALSIPGVIYRGDSGKLVRGGNPQPFNDVNSLPIPDYFPFFDQIRILDLHHVAPFIPFETSRGCWWGAKHHCTFCGIGDDIMKFRSKSDDVVLDEILTLSARHQLPDMFAVDSIINHRFYQSLLPQLAHLRADHELDLAFFFECKSNIRREQAFVFRNGGVREVQPGIESFDDHILSLMKKGTTAARQIQCLKLLAENGIEVAWNLIYGNPGEMVEDYREMIHAISYIHHLPPLLEDSLVPMQINRYAPYHETPDRYGIRNIRPRDYYSQLFPSPHVDLNELAFYFDYDLVDERSEELLLCYKLLKDAIVYWRKVYRPNSLLQVRGPGFVKIVDRRVWYDPLTQEELHPEASVVLSGIHYDVFVACDEVAAEDTVFRDLSSSYAISDLTSALSQMVSARIIYRSPSGQLINLPLLRETRPLLETQAEETGHTTQAATTVERVLA
jgi:ribosomal peptide maturation radical SAM protein 1